MHLDDNGVNNLVCGIVKKAVDDWKNAQKRLRKNPAAKQAEWIIIDCEKFFLSDYFTNLTGMDGEEFLERLKAQSLDVRRRGPREKY